MVAHRRMQSDAIVVLLDERGNVCTQVVEISIGIGVDLLPLERLQETFAMGVLIGVGRPAHGLNHVVRSQQGHVRVGGILDAAIGMVNQPRRSTAICLNAFGYRPTRLLAMCSPPLTVPSVLISSVSV
jgi:hypothetical protein